MKLLAVSLLLCAILAVANACCCCCCRVSDMSRYASQQNISEDCQVQFFVLKRDGSELDFHICVKNDSFCTSKEVSPCGATRTDCRGIEEQELADYFADTLPEVKGEVCVEPSGKLCLNTNIVYSTCRSKADERVCIPVDDGTIKCTEVPEIPQAYQADQFWPGRFQQYIRNRWY